MKLINDLITSNKCRFKNIGITDFFETKKYDSRRNEVYQITSNDKSLVLKYFFNEKLEMLKEIRILNKLKENSVKVPNVIFSDKEYYIMEHLQGHTLLEHLELSEKNSSDGKVSKNTKIILSNFVKWLEEFYRTLNTAFDSTMILSDVNFRNFIVQEDESIVGLDFEAVSQGCIIEDLGKICAYLLTHDTSFTDYKYSCVSFLESQMILMFDLDIKRLTEEKIKYLNNRNITLK